MCKRCKCTEDSNHVPLRLDYRGLCEVCQQIIDNAPNKNEVVEL